MNLKTCEEISRKFMYNMNKNDQVNCDCQLEEPSQTDEIIKEAKCNVTYCRFYGLY